MVNTVAFYRMDLNLFLGIMLVVVIMTTAPAAGMGVFPAVASHDAPYCTLVWRVFCATASSTLMEKLYMRSYSSESFLVACMRESG